MHGAEQALTAAKPAAPAVASGSALKITLPTLR